MIGLWKGRPKVTVLPRWARGCVPLAYSYPEQTFEGPSPLVGCLALPTGGAQTFNTIPCPSFPLLLDVLSVPKWHSTNECGCPPRRSVCRDLLSQWVFIFARRFMQLGSISWSPASVMIDSSSNQSMYVQAGSAAQPLLALFKPFLLVSRLAPCFLDFAQC
jgi:hypothetical protein